MTSAIDPQHIVLVEDSDEDHDTVCEALRLCGLPARLSRVSNGDDCMALLRRDGAARPAFVMLDLSTPGTDGRETLRLIKSDPLLRAIPVVVVTASANPRDVDFCYQGGANAYHVKPVRYPDHLHMLDGLLRYWLTGVVIPAALKAWP
jgi:CheY-like chemotaxis protein